MVGAFAVRLRRERFHVLAAGANQGAAFRFPVGGRWKAPDLVAERDGQVLVAEGKILARELFKSGPRTFSDFGAMAFVAEDPTAQATISAEVARRMATYGENRDPARLVINVAVFAGDDIWPWVDHFLSASVLSFVVDVASEDARRGSPTKHGWSGYKVLGF